VFLPCELCHHRVAVHAAEPVAVRHVSEILGPLLQDLAGALRAAGEESLAAMVSAVAESDQSVMDTFLASNELWGGAGSIADSAGVESSTRARKQIERILVRIGSAQIERGAVNPRIQIWLAAF
jgi:hypothetical protein